MHSVVVATAVPGGIPLRAPPRGQDRRRCSISTRACPPRMRSYTTSGSRRRRPPWRMSPPSLPASTARAS
eukprot:13148832-Alexandrium_andersonii.AAC.1